MEDSSVTINLKDRVKAMEVVINYISNIDSELRYPETVEALEKANFIKKGLEKDLGFAKEADAIMYRMDKAYQEKGINNDN